MHRVDLVEADKKLFAVSQVLYSGADVDMWFDWNRRLTDTLERKLGYWVLLDGVRIGGIMVKDNTLLYPFLVPPFCDRQQFWYAVLKEMRKRCSASLHIQGALDEDRDVLLTCGFHTDFMRQMMCRPAEECAYTVPEGFLFRPPEDRDVEVLAKTALSGYADGVDQKIFGIPTKDEVMKDMGEYFSAYGETGTGDMSVLAVEEKSGHIVGFCIAGIDKGTPLGFGDISELAVHPAYRHRGIARSMLLHVLSKAYGRTPMVKLCVTVGNGAAVLYRSLNFAPGPRFAHLHIDL